MEEKYRPQSRVLGLIQQFPEIGDQDATKKAEVDIVALHGLRAKSPDTWIAWKDGQNRTSGEVNWLKDKEMLPNVLPEARILTYCWSADYIDDPASDGYSTDRFLGHADSLLDRLSVDRRNNALFRASHEFHPLWKHYPGILKYTAGAVFLGTPFGGSWEFGYTNAQIRYRLALQKKSGCSQELIQYLRLNGRKDENGGPSPLDDVVKQFTEMIAHPAYKFPVVCSYETRPTSFSSIMRRIPEELTKDIDMDGSAVTVPQSSACLEGIESQSLDVRHNLLHKHASPDSDGFKRISAKVRIFADGAKDTIDERRKFREQEFSTTATGQWVLDRLNPVAGAAFNSTAEEHNEYCHAKTRIELLRGICRWAEDSDSKVTYWLNGMAGTGKSTISRTVTRQFQNTRQITLGASFFFKRGEGDRGNASGFVRTLAAQFAARHPIIALKIKDAIDNDFMIGHKTLREQFEQLLMDPLSRVSVKQKAFVVVVDALDECEKEEDIKLLIHLFSKAQTLKSPALRFFVTSRPETPNRLGFSKVKGTFQDFILHNVDAPTIRHDISVVLEQNLDSIREEFDSLEEGELSPHWPGLSALNRLVDMALPLFIFAATVCRFLRDFDTGDPEEKLRAILAFETHLPSRWKQRTFRCSRGFIVLLEQSLSVKTLSALLNLQDRQINNQLRSLHSVLNIPKDSSSPVRILHLSFKEFLVDQGRHGQRFWVNEAHRHQELATCCLQVMSESLREDICGIVWPGTDVSDLNSAKIHESIPSALRYACMHWASHVHRAGEYPDRRNAVLSFLSHNFLNWMEVLFLLEKGQDVLESLRKLRSIANPDNEMTDLLDDACRFALSCIAIRETPLQLYSSVLCFAPKNSKIRAIYEKVIPSWITLLPEVESDWDARLQTLEGHDTSVTTVAVSPDSKLIASGSFDEKIQIWSADTGEPRMVLRGHTDLISSVVFSPDSKLLASSSYDYTVRMWAVETGDVHMILQGHTLDVTSVAFSPDSELLASGSLDTTVILWEVNTGKILRTLRDHNRAVKSVAFSPDSKLIASGSTDTTARLCSVSTGACQRVLKGHTGLVTSVTISPDGSKLVSGSTDETVRLWSMDTGACQQIFKIEGDVQSLAVSRDSKTMAVASNDSTITVKSLDTAETLTKLEGHTDEASAVAFSPDGTSLVSGSWDATVQLWHVGNRPRLKVPRVQKDEFRSIFLALSADGQMLATASRDDMVRLWETKTMNAIRTFGPHGGELANIAFSPDSKMLLSELLDDRSVEIWCIETGERIHRLYPQRKCGNKVPEITFNGIPTSVRDISVPSLKQHKPFGGVDLRDSSGWVTWGGANVLWLPKTVRPATFQDDDVTMAACGSFLAMADKEGNLLRLGFSLERLAQLLPHRQTRRRR